MKKLLQFWKRISRGRKLLLNGLLILALAALLWALLGYPSLTEASAFRRGLRAAALPSVRMELLVEEDRANLPLAIGTDEGHSYVVKLDKTGLLGVRVRDAWAIPSPGTLWYADLVWDHNYSMHSILENDKSISAFAVKAPGANAALTLVFEDLRQEEEGAEEAYWMSYWSSGRVPLALSETRDGWFLFSFDKEDILAHLHSEKNGGYSFEEPYNSLSIWFDLYNHYPWVKLPAHLELITYDETGSVLTSEAWEPVPFE